MAEFAVNPSKIDLYGGEDKPTSLVTWREDYESRVRVHKDKVDEWIAWFRGEELQFIRMGMKPSSDCKALAEYSSKYLNMKMVVKEDVEEIVDHFEAQTTRFREQTEANIQNNDTRVGMRSEEGPQNEKHVGKLQNPDNAEDVGTITISKGKVPQSDRKEAEEKEQKDREIMALNLKIREMEKALEKAKNDAFESKKNIMMESISSIKERDSVLLSPKLRDRILSCIDPVEKEITSFNRVLLIRTTKIHVALNEALYLFQRDGAYMNNLLQRTKDAAEELFFQDMFENNQDMTTEPNKSWLRPVCSLAERCMFWAGRHMVEVGLRFKYEENYPKARLALIKAMELFQCAQDYHGDEHGGECNCDIGPVIEQWKQVLKEH